MNIKSFQDIAKSYLEFRRQMHQHPEIGLNCIQTRDRVATELTKLGYEVNFVGVAGLTTTIGQGNPVFLLRADMDALPITEETDLPFKSRIDGCMHACGHDFHTTMLLGACAYLKQHEQNIKGTIKFMFQHGEEIMEGAKDMIDHGLLSEPKPEAAMMVHVATGVPFDIGTYLFMNDGPCMAAVDWFDIKVQGVGGHGSTPFLGIDPIVPATNIVQALQNIHARELEPGSLVSLTLGSVSTTQVPNVIPDHVSLRGTLRTFDEKQRTFIKQRIQDIAIHIAKAYRCEAEVLFPISCPALIASPELNTCAKTALKTVVGDMRCIDLKKPSMASEDFAYISQLVPSISVLVCASDSRESNDFPLHHPKVIFDEDALAYGMLAYTKVAMDWLENNAL